MVEPFSEEEADLRFSVLLGLLLLPGAAIAQTEPAAVTAWFTQAPVENNVRMPKPVDALPDAPGTYGQGVLLTKPLAIENPLLDQNQGLITFWIQPMWNGNDGKTHRILRIGDPAKNGLLLEKSAQGMLRFVMASPKKVTVSRADVSGWKAGEWHQVGISWMHLNGKPLGTPLWIDKVAADGPIAGGNVFLDPSTMSDKKLWIGDASSGAVMDELIIRKGWEADKGQLETLWRDYFRAAPYTQIKITPNSCRVPSDKRIVNGQPKQFGIDALRAGKWEPITDNEVRYHPWADYDSKPMIKWTMTDTKVATIDENGRATGKSLGKCVLTAEFRGMKDAYNVEVIPMDQTDLDLIYVQMLPRYSWKALKDRPATGDKMTSVANIHNFGFKPTPAGVVVRFELIPDANHNLKFDDNVKPIVVQEKTIDKALNPREATQVSFSWNFPKDPVWIRVTVDPMNTVPELCEANNQTCELSTARPIRFATVPKQLNGFYDNKQINHVGSFSEYDWLNAQKLRFDIAYHEAVWPTTSPLGIQDSLRTDMYYDMKLGEWEQEPYVVNDEYYDGGFPVNEKIDVMAIDVAILHEFGHTTAGLPDLYGYPMHASGILLKDENGKPYAGGDLMPFIEEREDIVPLSRANNVPIGVGETSLMEGCHLSWIHPAEAGTTNYFRGYRGPRFWCVPSRLIPNRANYLQVFDINDKPLAGAAVYVYHVTQTNCESAETKYFADRPKFIGNVDADGRYLFPDNTDATWDDPNTDQVEGEYPVWNPFGVAKSTTGAPNDVAFTPNVWCVEGLLLVKIVSGDKTEFAWLSLTDFNEQFFSGNEICGTYKIRTSLPASTGVTPVVKPKIPEAIQKINLKPIAVTDQKEMTVKCGQTFVLDGSKSSDPEGQPLTYRWEDRSRKSNPRSSDQPIYKGTAPKDPGEGEFWFYVIDGLRASDPVKITVKFEK